MHTTATHTKGIPTQLVDVPTRSFGFAHFFGLLLSKAWLIVFFAAFSLLAAAIYLILAPKLYESRTAVEVEDKAPRISNVQDFETGNSGEQDLNLAETIKTIEQALTSNTLLLRVVKTNGLDKDLLFAPLKKDGSAYTDSELAERFKKRFKIANRRGTRLIDITVKDTDTKRAQRLAEAVVNDFIDQSFQKSDTSDRLQQEADRLRAKLQDAEQAAQKYREDHGVSLEDKQNIIVDNLKELNLKVAQAKAERLKLEADVAIIKQAGTNNPEQLSALPSVTSLPLVASLRQQLADREAKYRAESQLVGLKQALNRALIDAANTVVKWYESAKAAEAMLTSALQEQEQKALELNKIEIPYNALVREVDADRALYESVVTRMKATDVAEGIWGKHIRVVETPLVAAKPVEPAPLRILLLSLLGGVALGYGLVIVIDMADNSMRTVDQAEAISGLTALAAIPESKRKNRKREPVLTSNPASHEAEAFRTLRTSISLRDPYTGHETLLFTSANPGEGKTYCCLNYSVALAQIGFRTLLIDADIRRARLSKIALADGRAQGLTDCLTIQENAIDCCKPTGIKNLFLLPAGQKRSTPSELFASCDFVSLLKELAPHFDRIVLDSAPINAVSDTQLIARHVQSICFVIRASKTPADAIVRACALLRQAGTSPDGFVFNRMPGRSRDSYYYSAYAGGYAKGTPKQKLKAKPSKGDRSRQGNNSCAY
jgi:succinoglycan biosynthesis transport protein ExoP